MLQFKLKNILTLSIFITLFLAAGPAVAQCSFTGLDRNGDGLMEYEEYNQGLYDYDYYSKWDSNEDGFIMEEEWGVGTETWDGNDEDIEFDFWDLNNDDRIDESEFNYGFYNTLDDDDNLLIDENEWNRFDSQRDGIFCV